MEEHIDASELRHFLQQLQRLQKLERDATALQDRTTGTEESFYTAPVTEKGPGNLNTSATSKVGQGVLPGRWKWPWDQPEYPASDTGDVEGSDVDSMEPEGAWAINLTQNTVA